MALLILLTFIAVPLIEIAVFIEIGGRIGLVSTLAVVIATALAGTYMLRLQGLSTLHRAQTAMNRGELPLREVFDGLCLLVAGALLLTPGFVTDAIGGSLFIPAVRAGLRRLLGQWFVTSGRVHMHHGPGPDHDRDGTTIDGEFEDLDDVDEVTPAGKRIDEKNRSH